MALALVVLSCGGQKVNLSPVASWAATLSYMSRLWIENRVPTSLLHNSIASARKEIEKARKQSDHPQLAAFDASAAALDRAVTNGDKRAAARESARCRNVYEALDALAKASR